MDIGKSFTQPQPDMGILKKFMEKQAWYQKRQAEIGFSYLIGKPDRLTSVLLPGAMFAAACVFLGKGLHNLYTGEGKGDQ